MTKKGNPIGRGTKTISVNLPEDLANSLGALAKESKESLSGYCRFALFSAVKNGQVIDSVVMTGRTPVAVKWKTSSGQAGLAEAQKEVVKASGGKVKAQ